MFSRLNHQATAFTLAAALTLGMLAGIQQLTTPAAEAGALAAATAASQVVSTKAPARI